MNSLFEYIDFREYIKDYFAFKKSKNSHYSLRTLSEQAGFKARDYILRVMNGSRNLSEKGIRMLSEAMKHSEKEGDYFKNLVLFNQADDAPTKERYFKKIQEYKKLGTNSKLQEAQYLYLSNWYNVVLRSLLPVLKTTADLKKVARMIDPPLTESEVRKSVELLLSLGLISLDAHGKYQVETPGLTVDNHVKSVALANAHRMFIELSRRSIDIHKPDEREISGVTMSISEKGYLRIRDEIREFRKKLMDIAANDCDEDRVYHCNLHFFPVSKRGIRL